MIRATSVSYVERGVWVAPWLSEQGYPVLVALNAEHRKLAEREVLPEDSYREIAEELWLTVEQCDPVPPSGRPTRAHLTLV